MCASNIPRRVVKNGPRVSFVDLFVCSLNLIHTQIESPFLNPFYEKFQLSIPQLIIKIDIKISEFQLLICCHNCRQYITFLVITTIHRLITTIIQSTTSVKLKYGQVKTKKCRNVDVEAQAGLVS